MKEHPSRLGSKNFIDHVYLFCLFVCSFFPNRGDVPDALSRNATLHTNMTILVDGIWASHRRFFDIKFNRVRSLCESVFLPIGDECFYLRLAARVTVVPNTVGRLLLNIRAGASIKNTRASMKVKCKHLPSLGICTDAPLAVT